MTESTCPLSDSSTSTSSDNDLRTATSSPVDFNGQPPRVPPGFSHLPYSFEHWQWSDWLSHPVLDVNRRLTAFPSLENKEASLTSDMNAATTKEHEYVIYKELRQVEVIKKQQSRLWKNIDEAYNVVFSQLSHMEAVRAFNPLPWFEYKKLMRDVIAPFALKYYDSFLDLVESEQRACQLVHGDQCSVVSRRAMQALLMQRDSFVADYVARRDWKPAQNHFLRRAINRFNQNIGALFKEIADHWDERR